MTFPSCLDSSHPFYSEKEIIDDTTWCSKTSRTWRKIWGFFPKLEELIISFAQVEAAYDDYRALRDFYGSEDWFHFRTQETEGLKAGILSEDQLYELICEHNDLLGRLLRFSSTMYRHL